MTASRPAPARASGLSIDQILAIRSLGGTERPQWSPDGSQITFVSSIGGTPELRPPSTQPRGDDGSLPPPRDVAD